jgi:hypothetical protein
MPERVIDDIGGVTHEKRTFTRNFILNTAIQTAWLTPQSVSFGCFLDSQARGNMALVEVTRDIV